MSKAPKNILEGRKTKGPIQSFMTPMTITALVLVGVFAFAALIVLSGFADNWRDKDNGRAHAFSKSAIGYSGLSQLLSAQGTDVVLSRNDEVTDQTNYGLKIITLDRPLSKPLSDDFDLTYPTLIVMPKWITTPMHEHRGWRRKAKPPIGPTYDFFNFEKALPDTAGDVTFKRAETTTRTRYNIKSEFDNMPSLSGAQIEFLQTIEGDNLDPLIHIDGRMLLAQIGSEPVYILSDPDILNTQGLTDIDRAEFALDVVAGVSSWEGLGMKQIVFDLTTHGFGTSDNLIKYMLRPPFLAATLCLLAAGFLTAWQAFARFGDPEEVIPDYALGKSTLADNAARFIHIAGRETRMAPGYVDLIRRRAAKDMNISGHSEADINRLLTRRSEKIGTDHDWQSVSTSTQNANSKSELLRAAKTLYRWKQEISHDRK